MPSRSRKQCSHGILQLGPSAYAKEVGYNQPELDQTSDATTKKSASNTASTLLFQHRDVASQPEAFPAPLVLPNDELAFDPEYKPQSFPYWVRMKERNNPTRRRRSLYVAEVPEISSEVEYMRKWAQPRPKTGARRSPSWNLTSLPFDGFMRYVSAFYHGMPVNSASPLRFVSWDDIRDPDESDNIEYVGLAAGDSCTRIRARPSPDGVFERQLNLEDVLDFAISILPQNAYAMVLLVDHDLYEDEDDDFCCGRAYGGSRVAVVSTARYHPVLDDFYGIDYSHVWPMSHCKSYVEEVCANEGLEAAGEASGETNKTSGPLRAAVDAVKDLKKPTTKKVRENLWFSRVAKTAVHELGHCFGMDHCVHYACVMQGTAGMVEDLRQPPYLCPVCLDKVSYAVAHEVERRTDEGKIEYFKERYSALTYFCLSREEAGMFAAYGAWLTEMLQLI